MKGISLLCGLIAVLLSAGNAYPEQDTARGVVFEDVNGNGLCDPGEPGVAGVAVSIQEQVVLTGDDGRYTLPVTDDTIIFVTKPSGYAVPLGKDNLPRFYYIHKPNGSPKLYHRGVDPTGPLPESINFPLNRRSEPPAFTVIAMADPQPETSQEVDYVRDDVLDELVGSDAAFGVTLGDIMFDHLWLYDRYNDYVGRIGIPFYNIIGNHDMNYDADDDDDSDETFHRYFGPNYYSWDYARLHFIALDTIIWDGPGQGTGRYHEAITDRQLTWLANDVRHVPQDKLIVLLMHAPLHTFRDDEAIPGTKRLFDIMKHRPKVLALAGHTHWHEHVFFDKRHGWEGEGGFHLLICATACGSWWGGPKDYRGIPVADQRDGIPNGYVILEVNGTDYVTTYKAAGFDRDYRMRIYPPGSTGSSPAARTKLLVNVFDGSERSNVECSLDGAEFVPMTRTPQLDPLAEVMLSGVMKSSKSWANPAPCPHMWETALPEPPSRGTHVVTSRVTDQYDRTYEQSKIFVFR